MQKLHLVGVTTDRDGLILSVRRGARSGSYLLTVDDDLIAAVDEHRQRQAELGEEAPEEEAAPRAQSTLPVREIQARLRRGRSVAEVAAAAGVDEPWVERFAPPVLAERARVVAAARAGSLDRARLGPSATPLGEAVQRHLADRGISLTAEEQAERWTAHLIDDGRWSVRFTFRHRGQDRVLAYELDEPTGALVALDRTSAQMGYVTPAGPPTARAGGRRPTAPPGSAPRSASARERERATAAMRKVATQQAAEAERAVARRAAVRAQRTAEEERAGGGRAERSSKAPRSAPKAGKVGAAAKPEAGTTTKAEPAKGSGRGAKPAKQVTKKAKPATKKAKPAKQATKSAAGRGAKAVPEKASGRGAKPAKQVTKKAKQATEKAKPAKQATKSAAGRGAKAVPAKASGRGAKQATKKATKKARPAKQATKRAAGRGAKAVPATDVANAAGAPARPKAPGDGTKAPEAPVRPRAAPKAAGPGATAEAPRRVTEAPGPAVTSPPAAQAAAAPVRGETERQRDRPASPPRVMPPRTPLERARASQTAPAPAPAPAPPRSAPQGGSGGARLHGLDDGPGQRSADRGPASGGGARPEPAPRFRFNLVEPAGADDSGHGSPGEGGAAPVDAADSPPARRPPDRPRRTRPLRAT
ncbi:MAG: septation protein SepH [Acidimicrobiia bacterium]